MAMGTEATKSVVMVCAMRAMINGSDLFEQRIWRHSIECALIARKIAPLLKDKLVDPENAFMAGLLHDVGLMVLHRLVPTEIELMYMDPSAEATSIEEEALTGVTHPVVGAELCRAWGLSEDVVEAVAMHRQYVTNEVVSPLSDVVYTANMICMSYGTGLHRPHDDQIEHVLSVKRLGITKKILDQLVEHLVLEVAGGLDFYGAI